VRRRPFLTAEWRDLLMVNFAVPEAVLRPLVPRGTELDDHRGVTYVSLVAFRFLETRVLGLPVPFHRDFEELNLRFYVRRETPEGSRRAVVFVREVVPRAAIAAVARAIYNEPYVALPMRSSVGGTPPAVDYAWRWRGQWFALRARATGEGVLPEPGAHEDFITHHLWGYTRQRDGGTLEYAVDHPPWRVWRVEGLELEPPPGAFYGHPFADLLQRPVSAFLAEGSAVTVFRPTRLEGAR